MVGTMTLEEFIEVNLQDLTNSLHIYALTNGIHDEDMYLYLENHVSYDVATWYGEEYCG